MAPVIVKQSELEIDFGVFGDEKSETPIQQRVIET
jgi:hypothetical protein